MDEIYRLTVHSYRYPWPQPLVTAHGVWRDRAGLIVTLTDGQGCSGQGEIAPLAAFGTETLTQAAHYCQGLGDEVGLEHLQQIPDGYPACQFGFATALQNIHSAAPAAITLLPHQVAHLVPLQLDAIAQINTLYHQGARVLKCKIGVAQTTTEQAIFATFSQQLPADIQFRLDANGHLTPKDLEQWGQVGARWGNIEFLEQPFPPSQLALLCQSQPDFPLPLALDESVSTWQNLQAVQDAGWQGIYVIKIAIAGWPARWLQFCQRHQLEVVYSSVFETAIGRQAALQLTQFYPSSRVLGFGTQTWFDPPLAVPDLPASRSAKNV